MRAAEAKPFPWGTLDRTSTAEARAFSALRRFARRHAAPGAVAEALGELVGGRCEVTFPHRPHRACDGGAFAPAVALALVASEPGGLDATVIELEAPLAVELVVRALRRAPPAVVDLANPVGERLAGALAAVLATALRRGAPGVPLRVLAARSLDGRALPTETAPQPPAHDGKGGRTALMLTVRIDGVAHAVRIAVPDQAGQVPEPSFDRADLRRLGDVPLSVPVVAAASWARHVDVAALAPGDVWLPGAWPAPALRAIALAPPRAERGARVAIVDDKLVMQGDAVALPWEGPMDAAKGDALAEAMGDVPVVVRVEVGSAELPARAWAELGPGDVIALGRRLGEHAVLRVSGVEVARGELVELAGEIGVRIVTRTGQASP